MAPVETDVNVHRTPRELAEMADRALDMRPAMRRIVLYLYTVEERQFASKGMRSSDPWAALRPATRRIKRQQHLDPRPMRSSGETQESLTRRSPLQRLVVRRQSLRLGTRSKAAQFTQGGRTGRRQAARVISAITNVDRDVVAMEINDRLMGG